MRRRLWILTFLLLGLLTAFSESLLGLRTLEATTTEAATPVATTVSKLALRTIDPLLQSFRDGWTTPNIPGWVESTVGAFTFKLPKDFVLQSSKSAANFDAEIKDASGKRFAQLFVYQLEAYKLNDLFRDLTQSLYGNQATEEKSFEEFKDLGNGKTAYFTKYVLKNQTTQFPILFLYQQGKEGTDLKSSATAAMSAGTVVMLLFEPIEYTKEDQQPQLQKWIEGIAGSWLATFAPVTQTTKKTQTTAVQPTDDFGSTLVSAIAGRYWVTEIPKAWNEEQGESFWVYYPNEFYAKYFSTEGIEGFDFIFENSTMAKLMIGNTEETLFADDIFDELYTSYLATLGSYTLVKETPYLDFELGFLKVYELDFANNKAWVVLFSEATEEEFFYGTFIAFIGIAPIEDPKTWEDKYITLLMSVAF